MYGTENVEPLHRRAVDELVEQYGIAATEVDLVEGSPAVAVIDTGAKRRADLVVVGATGRRGALATAIGSTAESVAAGVSCDVLIVPATPSERRGVAEQRSKVG